MTTRSAYIASATLALLCSGSVLLAQSDAPLPATPEATIAAAAASAPDVHSGVRIVRLSQVKGEVKLDRNASDPATQAVSPNFENAFANVPIIQGATLKTDTGVAEVEFEDNSTLRLTPDTVVQFTELRRQPSGFTESTVKVLQGTVFVSLAPTHGNQFMLTSGEGTFLLAPDTRLHFHEGNPKTTLAVLNGSVQAQVGAATTTATKKTTLEFNPANPAAAPTLVSHLEKTPFDDWDKQAVDYHKRYMSTSSFGNNFSGFGGTGSPVYGLSDMNYYGSFSGAGGCGSMWRPYLASAAWDPYSNGTLAYYPNAGYSWVSPYPWGWMPYHAGSWINCPGTGWGWQPGGNFNGLNNLTSFAINKHGITVPPPPTKTGHPRVLAVNTRPLLASGFANKETFVFSKDSAGLGVPRATFGKLGGVSRETLQHGAVTTAAYVAPPSRSAMQSGAHTVAFARAGANPATSASSASSGGWSGRSASAASVGLASAPSLSSSSAGAHGGGISAGGGASAGSGGAHH